MSLRTGVMIVGVLVASGCATRSMRAQAGALAAAGERLEAETAAFTAARTAVVQLRQSSLVQRKQEVAEQGQNNARTLAQWKVAGSEERARRLALFQGVVDASEAMYEVRDQGLLWEESVIHTRTALAIDHAALHRFVRDLVNLSRPGRFVDNVRFYVEYGVVVGTQVDEGLADVKAALAAAREAAKEAAAAPPTLITPIANPPGPPRPDPDPKPADPPVEPRPLGPDAVKPGPLPRDPTTPVTPVVTPTNPSPKP